MLAVVLEIMESVFNHFIESNAIMYVMEQRRSENISSLAQAPGRPAGAS